MAYQSDEEFYSSQFFASKHWNQLRHLVIGTFGPRCMCCNNDQFSGAEIQVDHVIPRSVNIDLESDITNLQVLCSVCNGPGGKGTKTIDYRNQAQRDALNRLKDFPLIPFLCRERRPSKKKS